MASKITTVHVVINPDLWFDGGGRHMTNIHKTCGETSCGKIVYKTFGNKAHKTCGEQSLNDCPSTIKLMLKEVLIKILTLYIE